MKFFHDSDIEFGYETVVGLGMRLLLFGYETIVGLGMRMLLAWV